jgi:hypothetical protein
VYEHFQGHHVAQIGIKQRQQAFDHDHRRGLHGNSLAGGVIPREIASRHLNRLAPAQRLYMLHHQGPIKRIKVVVIGFAPLLRG